MGNLPKKNEKIQITKYVVFMKITKKVFFMKKSLVGVRKHEIHLK